MREMSIREYARYKGISDTAVRKAIKNGRITPLADGGIDADVVDAVWEQNKDPSKIRDFEEDEHETQVPTASNVATYMQAKTANEVIKAKTAQLEFEKLKGDYVERKKAENHVFTFARSLRDNVKNAPARFSAEIAAKLNIDEQKLYFELENLTRVILEELSSSTFRFN